MAQLHDVSVFEHLSCLHINIFTSGFSNSFLCLSTKHLDFLQPTTQFRKSSECCSLMGSLVMRSQSITTGTADKTTRVGMEKLKQVEKANNEPPKPAPMMGKFQLVLNVLLKWVEMQGSMLLQSQISCLSTSPTYCLRLRTWRVSNSVLQYLGYGRALVRTKVQVGRVECAAGGRCVHRWCAGTYRNVCVRQCPSDECWGIQTGRLRIRRANQPSIKLYVIEVIILPILIAFPFIFEYSPGLVGQMPLLRSCRVRFIYIFLMIKLLRSALLLPGFKFSTGHHHSPIPKNETSVFFESVTSTVKGYLNPNYIVEHDPSLPAEERAKMKRFLIYKYDPENPNDQPKYVSYYIDLKKIPPMYLDALLYVKDNLDSTLAFRRSCREGICGSCAMNCDGLHTLACIKEIDSDISKPALITPLGHMFVLKDLVVDMTNFYSQYKTIQPYLKRKVIKKQGEREYLQSVEDRKKLDGLYECVLCACCSTSCPSYWWHPDEYLGPAILMQAYRWVIDSRDQYSEERLDELAKGLRLKECENIGMCTVTCPKGLDPQKSINELIRMVTQKKEKAQELYL